MECLYFREYNIRMSLNMFFWLRKGPPIKYVHNWRGDGGSSEVLQLRTGGGSVTPHVYVRTCTISFHVFGSIFILYCLVLIVEIQSNLS